MLRLWAHTIARVVYVTLGLEPRVPEGRKALYKLSRIHSPI